MQRLPFAKVRRMHLLGVIATVLLATGMLPAAAIPIRIAYSSNPGSLPLLVAQQRGLFEAEGVTVDAVDCNTGKECLRLMLQGKAQLATVADLPIVLAAFDRQRFVVVATISTNSDDSKVVARRNSGIRRSTDLVGRRVGTLMGTSAQYALDTQLLFDGADPDGVSTVDLPVADLRSALISGRVDAIAVFQPFASDLARALDADAVVLGIHGVYIQTWNLVSLPSGSEREAAGLTAVLRALHRACEWISREPAAARALLQRASGMSAAMVESSWPTLTYDVVLKQSLLTTLEGQARWAQRREIVSGPAPNFLHFVDGRALRRVRPAAVTLVP